MTAPSARPPAALPVVLDGVGFTYPTRPDRRVLTDVTLTVNAGERIGLIGENGSGKSTVLRLAAGALVPDRGTVRRPRRTGLLHQQAPGDAAATVGSVVENAVTDVRALAARIEELAVRLAERPGEPDGADAWDTALRDAELAGLWSLDARIAAVLAGLGLLHLPADRPVAGISGGERRRLQLAALLLARPEALLLDEPTNHLDDDAMDFLARELRSWRGPVLIASHDRWFLDTVAGGIVDLDPGLDPDGAGGDRQGTAWTGGYSDYRRARERGRRRWSDRFVAQEEERQRLEADTGLGEGDLFHRSTSKTEARASTKFSADRAAKTLGNRLRSARHRLDALERGAVLAPPDPLRLAALSVAPDRGQGAVPTAGTLVRARAVAVPGRLAAVDLDLTAGQHLLVEGPNGAGKSTLLDVLAGRLEPGGGQLERADGVVVAKLDQHETAADADDPAIEAFARAVRAGLDASGRPVPADVPDPARLGLLPVEDLVRPMRDLSPGQRRRVALAAVLAAPPDVLLLDEPTNHLALSLVEELETALADWDGTVVLATHDRWVRERWTGARLVLAPV